MNEPKFATKLKKKWNIASNWDFILIMLVFSLAGMSIGFVRPLIFHILHLDHAPIWVKIIAYIPIIVPIYQCGLIFFGTLLGQFNFFWAWEKKFAARLLSGLKRARA